MIRTFATLCRTSLPTALPLAAPCDQSKTLLLSHVALVLSEKCYVTILFTQCLCPLLPHVIHLPPHPPFASGATPNDAKEDSYYAMLP